MKRICEQCKGEIVYGVAVSRDNKEKYFLCDECANVISMGYDADGEYTPPAFFPIHRPGHC